jgi:hypothetical protein
LLFSFSLLLFLFFPDPFDNALWENVQYSKHFSVSISCGLIGAGHLLKERDKVNHKRYIQIGEESVLQERFIQIYKEFYTRSPVQKYCSLAVFSLGITVNYGIKKKNYKPSLDNETKRGLYKYGNFILKHDFPS